MPIYQFEAMTNAGEEVKDEVEASSQEDAAVKVRNLGYFPTKIREKSAARATKRRAPRARERARASRSPSAESRPRP